MFPPQIMSICYLASPTNRVGTLCNMLKLINTAYNKSNALMCLNLRLHPAYYYEANIKQVGLNKDIYMCLVCHIKLDNLTNPTPSNMSPLLQEFADLFTQPTILPLSHSIEHTIDLIPRASLPNAPSYRLAPQEATEIECKIGQLLD